MKKILYAVVFPIMLFLAACGPSNQLIGSWQSEPVMGISSKMEFKGGAMISSSMMGGMEQKQEVKVDEYKVEKDRVGVTISDPQSKQTATVWFQLVDADTIVQNNGLMEIRYHRVK